MGWHWRWLRREHAISIALCMRQSAAILFFGSPREMLAPSLEIPARRPIKPALRIELKALEPYTALLFGANSTRPTLVRLSA